MIAEKRKLFFSFLCVVVVNVMHSSICNSAMTCMCHISTYPMLLF